jgi:putative transcriptional regulator
MNKYPHPIQTGSLVGMMLLASPALKDNVFEKAIIYICAHDSDGAIGLIINKPISDITLRELFAYQQEIPKKVPRRKFPVLTGGPINAEQFFALSIAPEQEKKFEQEQALIFHSDVDHFLEEYVKTNCKDKFIVAKGISMWEPGQLEYEIQENSWFVEPADERIIFSQRIKNKWGKLIHKLGIDRPTQNIVHYSGNA